MWNRPQFSREIERNRNSVEISNERGAIEWYLTGHILTNIACPCSLKEADDQMMQFFNVFDWHFAFFCFHFSFLNEISTFSIFFVALTVYICFANHNRSSITRHISYLLLMSSIYSQRNFTAHFHFSLNENNSTEKKFSVCFTRHVLITSVRCQTKRLPPTDSRSQSSRRWATRKNTNIN